MQQRPTCRHQSSLSARWEAKKPPSTAFTMSVCAFYHVTGCCHPQITFREPFFQETRAYLGKEKHNAPTRPPLLFKLNAGPQSNVVSCLPTPRPRLEIIWVQGKPGRGLLFAYQTKTAWVLAVVMVLTWKSSLIVRNQKLDVTFPVPGVR